MTFPRRIERLLAEHRLEAIPFDDREIDIVGYEFILEKLEAYEDG